MEKEYRLNNAGQLEIRTTEEKVEVITKEQVEEDIEMLKKQIKEFEIEIKEKEELLSKFK